MEGKFLNDYTKASGHFNIAILRLVFALRIARANSALKCRRQLEFL